MSDDTVVRERGEPEAAWPSFALPRGTVVNGYRLERILGNGGFGITYLAADLLQQRFAIKEYYPQQFATRQGMTVGPTTAEDAPLFDECRARFLREAQALVLLGRTNVAGEGIVRVQTYFEAFGTCFLVMDYIEGDNLATILRQQPGGLPPARLHSLLVQLLAILRIVHRAGLLHRDIKPANIIVRPGDRLVLIDFGATRQTSPGDSTTFTQIYSGGYGPPEQMLGLPQGEFSDIYAVGAVCYRAIGASAANALARRNAQAFGRADPQQPAATIGAGRYPATLLAAIDAAMALDPAKRPQSVDAMLALLGSDEPDIATVAAPKAVMATSQSPARRSLWAAVAGVAALAVIGGGYLALWQPPEPQPMTAAQAPPPSQPLPTTSAAAPPAPPVIERPPPAAEVPPASPTAAAVAPPPSPAIVPPAPPQPPPATEAPPASPTAAAVAPTPSPEIVPPAPPQPPPAAEAPSARSESGPPAAPKPPSRPAPTPPTPLQQAQAAAGSLGCAALRVSGAPEALRVSGIAAAGAALDRLLADLRTWARVMDDVTRLDGSACKVIEALAPAILAGREGSAPPMAVRPDQPSVAIGAHLGIGVTSALPVLYVDLYQPDGTVRHVLQPPRTGSPVRRSADWTATSPLGGRLVVAMAAAAPLDLEPRPDVEVAAHYLDLLRPLLANAAARIAADLATVTVRTAEPLAVTKPSPRLVGTRPEKCANIISRAQLGETLSDAELAALRSECRS